MMKQSTGLMMQGRMFGGKRIAALMAMLLLVGGVSAISDNSYASTTKSQQQLIEVSAKASLAGREACQRDMHEDAEEFQQCASQLLRSLPQKTPEQKYTYLGTAYYAWLASTSAAKGGLPNAQKSALYFLAIFRPLQKKLGVADLALCKTIEGDCDSRIARMLVMERERNNK